MGPVPFVKDDEINEVPFRHTGPPPVIETDGSGTIVIVF
jgi:hypothetical protein